MAPMQAPLARRMDRALSTGSAPDAMREALALTMLARGEEVAEFVWQCRELAMREPSPGPYSTVAELDSWYPQDAGAAASLLLSRVQLSPGECVFVGAGVPHAYLSGLAAEIMANSDNVLRAGLTTKHVDLPGLLESVDTAPRNVNQPPERLSPSISRFAPPVEEFALAEVDPTAGGESVRLAGPLIALAVHGKPVIDANGSARALTPGSAMFLPATTDRFTVAGTGRLLLAYCPSA
jgi:mannose-6-phosphate isomerase